jgi:hypothetical protein
MNEQEQKTPLTRKALRLTQGLFRASAETNGFADHARAMEQQRNEAYAVLRGVPYSCHPADERGPCLCTMCELSRRALSLPSSTANPESK